MSKKLKVLISGPVQGSFSLLAKKLQNLQKSKAGPFDLCLCVGPFFATSPNKNEKEMTDMRTQAQDLLSDLKIPLPVYFVDLGQVPSGISLPLSNNNVVQDDDEIDLDADEDQEEKVAKSDFNGTKLAPNVFWLNGAAADILSLPHVGLNGKEISPQNKLHETLIIAYVNPHTAFSSIANPMTSSSSSLLEQKARHASYLGCDILLTSEYGQGLLSSDAILFNDKHRIIQSFNSNNSTPLNLNDMGSYDIAEFATLARPRYHVAASSNAISFQHFTSLPFRNVAQGVGTEMHNSIMQSLHVSRFISLGCVISPAEAKQHGKSRKFLHALGILPIMTMNQVELNQEPNDTVNNPYTDEAYSKDALNSNQGNSKQTHYGTNNKSSNGKLSEAQARRILVEQEQQQYRWNTTNLSSRKKRSYNSSQEQINQQTQAANDPNNKCLFIHGLDKDPTLDGHLLLKTFQSFGSSKVRCKQHKSFGFIEFETHDQAKKCLEAFSSSTNGSKDTPQQSGILINGTYLGLKWSSGGAVSIDSTHGTFVDGVGESSALTPPSKRQRVTEAEASDSVSLYFKLPSQVNPNNYALAFDIVRLLMESSLEDAMNVGVTDESERITAKTEPALAVSLRYPNKPKQNQNTGDNSALSSPSVAELCPFVFLVFASHAGASMGIASVTGHPDGGKVQIESLQKLLPASNWKQLMQIIGEENLQHLSLYWARGSKQTYNIKDQIRNRYPVDTRTDCWFCLASPTCETHLIITIKEKVYITMPKGALDNFHALIVPIGHPKHDMAKGVTNYNDNEEAESDEDREIMMKEVCSLKEELRDFARKTLKKELFVFEHSISTKSSRMYHTHIQCIPIERDICKTLEGTLLNTAKKYDTEIKLLHEGDLDLWGGNMNLDKLDLLCESGYFYGEVPVASDDGVISYQRYLHVTQPAGEEAGPHKKKSLPLQFGREVLASAIGKEHYAHWKACVVDKAKETDLALNFQENFTSYESKNS